MAIIGNITPIDNMKNRTAIISGSKLIKKEVSSGSSVSGLGLTSIRVESYMIE